MPCRIVFIAVFLFCLVSDQAHAHSRDAAPGKSLLSKHCGRCHSVDIEGPSPLSGAPPFREIFTRVPLEGLEFELSEGAGSRHTDMPQMQFSTEQIAEIISYLQDIGSESGRSDVAK